MHTFVCINSYSLAISSMERPDIAAIFSTGSP